MPVVANTTAQLQRLVESAARKHGVSEDQVTPLAETAVRFIVEIYGGQRLFIPIYQHALIARDNAIIRGLRDGLDPRKIARQFNLTLSKVLQIGTAVVIAQANGTTIDRPLSRAIAGRTCRHCGGSLHAGDAEEGLAGQAHDASG